MSVIQTPEKVRNLAWPDEVRNFVDHGRAEVVRLNDRMVIRNHFEPGWRWSADVRPISGTGSCRSEHLGYCVSGRMRIMMDDGETFEIGPGDVTHIPPGHDAATIGTQTCVFIDFGTVQRYAKA